MSSVISFHAVELYDCKHGEILQKISSSLLKYCPSLTRSLLFPFSYVLSPGLFFQLCEVGGVGDHPQEDSAKFG
jgi:hypothetical protein